MQTKQVNVRFSTETFDLLCKLCAVEQRTKSNMINFLVREAWIKKNLQDWREKQTEKTYEDSLI